LYDIFGFYKNLLYLNRVKNNKTIFAIIDHFSGSSRAIRPACVCPENSLWTKRPMT